MPRGNPRQIETVSEYNEAYSTWVRMGVKPEFGGPKNCTQEDRNYLYEQIKDFELRNK